MKRAMLIIPLISVTLFASCNKQVKYLELPCKITTYENGVLEAEITQEIKNKNVVKRVVNVYSTDGEIKQTIETEYTYDSHDEIATMVEVDKSQIMTITTKETYERKYLNNLIIWEKMTREEDNTDGEKEFTTIVTEQEYKNNVLVWQKKVEERDDGDIKKRITTISERELKNNITIWQKFTKTTETVDYLNSNEKATVEVKETHREIDNLNRLTKEKIETSANDKLVNRTTNTYTYTGNNKNYTTATNIQEAFIEDGEVRVLMKIENNKLDNKGNIVSSIVYTTQLPSSKQIYIMCQLNGYDKHNNCIHKTEIAFMTQNNDYYIRDNIISYHKNNPDKIEKEIEIRVSVTSSGEKTESTTRTITYDEYDRRLNTYTEVPDFAGSGTIIREEKRVYDQLIIA